MPPESPAERAARHAKILANLTVEIPEPYRPPPKPRATYHKAKPGDRLRLSCDWRREGGAVAPAGSVWGVSSCDSDGMWLALLDAKPWTTALAPGTAVATAPWRWTGEWQATFVKVPRPRKPKKLVDILGAPK